MSWSERASSRLRIEPAVWLLPVSALLATLVVRDGDDPATSYPLAVAVDAHLGLIVLVPIAAGCAAWKAGRVRRAGWHRRPWRRCAARLAVDEVLVTTAVQLTAYGIVLAVTGLASAARTVPVEPWLLAIAVSALIAASALGWAAGWWLRGEIAVPVVIVATYLSLVTPPAFEPLWLRHLTGIHASCCTHDQVLARQAVTAPVQLALAVTVIALLVVAAGTTPVVLIAAAALAAGVIAVVPDGVHPLGVDPTVARTSAVSCAGDRPTLCLWPEQEHLRHAVAPVIAGALDRWEAEGLVRPARVTTRPNDAGSATLVLSLQDDVSPDLLRWLLASGMVPELSPACTEASVPIELADAVLVAQAAMTILAGAPKGETADGIGADLAGDVRSLLGAAPAARSAWVADVADAARTCDADVPALPG